jgi:hypothetical protein
MVINVYELYIIKDGKEEFLGIVKYYYQVLKILERNPNIKVYKVIGGFKW